MESEIEKLRSELQQANARERDLKDELANTEHKNQAQGMEIAALASDLSETRAELARLKAESARLAALVDDQGITLAFVHGVLIVIEASPDSFNMEGLREAIKRVARALTNQDAAMRSGGEGEVKS